MAISTSGPWCVPSSPYSTTACLCICHFMANVECDDGSCKHRRDVGGNATFTDARRASEHPHNIPTITFTRTSPPVTKTAPVAASPKHSADTPLSDEAFAALMARLVPGARS